MIRSSEQLLYSRSAAARILGVPVEQIRRVEVWPFVVLVVPRRGFKLRPRFVSKRVFKEHFVEFRRESARGLLVVAQNGAEFEVLNPENNNQYKVVVGSSNVKCACEDYRNQLQFLGKGCCKHGYKVLYHLGFTRLSEYVSSRAAQRLRTVLNSG